MTARKDVSNTWVMAFSAVSLRFFFVSVFRSLTATIRSWPRSIEKTCHLIPSNRTSNYSLDVLLIQDILGNSISEFFFRLSWSVLKIREMVLGGINVIFTSNCVCFHIKPLFLPATPHIYYIFLQEAPRVAAERGDARCAGLRLAPCDGVFAFAGMFGLCFGFLPFSDPYTNTISKVGAIASALGIKSALFL